MSDAEDVVMEQPESRQEAVASLSRLKWVGERLAARLIDAGFDSCAALAGADQQALGKIPGINRRAVPGIIAEAAQLAAAGKSSREERVARLRGTNARLQQQVRKLAVVARERFAGELEGRQGARLEKELLKLAATLEQAEGRIGSRPRRAGKLLAKAERRLDETRGGTLKQMRKRLRRARKAVKKAGA
jgi:hypothetical protein